MRPPVRGGAPSRACRRPLVPARRPSGRGPAARVDSTVERTLRSTSITTVPRVWNCSGKTSSGSDSATGPGLFEPCADDHATAPRMGEQELPCPTRRGQAERGRGVRVDGRPGSSRPLVSSSKCQASGSSRGARADGDRRDRVLPGLDDDLPFAPEPACIDDRPEVDGTARLGLDSLAIDAWPRLGGRGEPARPGYPASPRVPPRRHPSSSRLRSRVGDRSRQGPGGSRPEREAGVGPGDPELVGDPHSDRPGRGAGRADPGRPRQSRSPPRSGSGDRGRAHSPGGTTWTRTLAVGQDLGMPVDRLVHAGDPDPIGDPGRAAGRPRSRAGGHDGLAR